MMVLLDINDKYFIVSYFLNKEIEDLLYQKVRKVMLDSICWQVEILNSCFCFVFFIVDLNCL